MRTTVARRAPHEVWLSALEDCLTGFRWALLPLDANLVGKVWPRWPSEASSRYRRSSRRGLSVALEVVGDLVVRSRLSRSASRGAERPPWRGTGEGTCRWSSRGLPTGSELWPSARKPSSIGSTAATSAALLCRSGFSDGASGSPSRRARRSDRPQSRSPSLGISHPRRGPHQDSVRSPADPVTSADIDIAQAATLVAPRAPRHPIPAAACERRPTMDRIIAYVSDASRPRRLRLPGTRISTGSRPS